jgi:hypothetical protein
MMTMAGLLVWACLAGAQEPGLVGRWDFDSDDAAGLLVLDASGNANHGQLHGAQWVPQGDGHALRFSGDDQYVVVGAPEALDITGPITHEAWVHPERIPDAEAGIAGKSFGSYGLTYYKDGSCYWYIGSGGNKCSAPLAPGLWIHLAGIFDGETLRLYINGTLADETESPFANIPSDGSFQIGRMRANGTDVPTPGFPGVIDDVRVYNRALTADEILAHYNAEAGQYGGPSASNDILLTAYPYFDKEQVYADLDCSRLFPRPEELRASLVLRPEGDAGPVEWQQFTLTQDNLVLRDVVFEVSTRGSYTLVARVEQDGELRAEEAVVVPFPEAFEVPTPDQEVVPPLEAAAPPLECRVTLHERGGFSVEAGGSVYNVGSTYSYPHGGFNVFSASEDAGQAPEKAWRVTLRQGQTPAAYAQGEFYSVQRTVKADGHRVWVKDTITNLTNAPIGIMLSNYLDLGGHKDVSCSPVPNPSIFASVDGQGIGMVALDDVYLEHYATFFEDNAIGIRDHTFALDANASYTLEWAIYANVTGNYYDFINDIRRDLGVNRTIEGSFAFIDRREAPSRDYVERRGLAYVSVGCLGHPPDNPGLSLEGIEFVEYPQEMALLERQFAETRDRFPGIQTMFHIAHSLYTTNRPDELFPDARVVNSDGEQTMYGGNNPDYYSRYFSKENVEAGYRWYIFYPTMENSFGKAMLDAIEVMLGDIGCTSMFADGFTHGYGGRFTYNTWDGHTADIDPETKTITRQYASVNLLAQEVLVRVARKVEAAGGVVICNSYPGTRTVHNENVLYCIESASGDAQLLRLHLVPGPTALGNHIRLQNGSPRDIYDDIRSKLNYGGLYFYYGDKEVPHPLATVHMFPITPMELHEGWVKGEERIITTLSGVYGWPDSTDLHRVYRYDGRGIETEHGWYSTVRENGVSTQVDPNFNEMAIIERVPMTLEADAPANGLIREYDKQVIRLDVRARGEIRLTIRNGAFPVVAGKRYLITRGDETQEVTAQTDGVLTIVDVVKGEADYAIRPAQ